MMNDNTSLAGIATVLRIFVVSLAACAMIFVSICPAAASLFGPSGLSPEFCKQKTFRQTVVYIDDTMMRNDEKAWALDLNNRLDGSMMPGERVTVVQLSPVSGTSREIWSGCWPGYTDAQRAALEKKSHFFTSDPIRDLKAQRSFFTLDLGIALTKVYDDSTRRAATYKISTSSLPHKDIIAALASDGARFSQSTGTIRVIVYSDLAQNSQLASVFASAPSPPVNYGHELGVYFPHSVFYIYGVGSDVTGTANYLGTARTFWEQVLRLDECYCRGARFGPSHPEQNSRWGIQLSPRSGPKRRAAFWSYVAPRGRGRPLD